MLHKSSNWSLLKSLGNPEGIKWTASPQNILDSIQRIQFQEELNKYALFEPFFISQAEDYFDPDLFHLPDYERITVLLTEAMNNDGKFLSNKDFPIEWGYEIPEEDFDYREGTSRAGEIEKFLATSLTSLENQLEALKNKGSNFNDFDVDRHKFFFTKNFLPVYVPRPNRVQKSKTGKGNDFQNCNVIDNDFIYCPPSDKCLIDCLSYGKTLTSEVQENILKFLKEKKVFRFNIASCNVSDIAKIIGVKFNMYRTNSKKLRYPYEEGQIILCLMNSHWIILKKRDSLLQCFEYAQQNIQWTEKPIEDCSFDVGFQTPKYYECKDEEAFADTWIQDFEAYPDNITGKFIPYATGFVKLQDIYDFTQGKKSAPCPTRYVFQEDDSECIIKMLTTINKLSKKITKEIPSKKDATKMQKVSQKRDIYIYAHNSANFDAFFYLNVKGIECKNMVEKGGIMSMTIGGEQFQNCNFIIRDTRKFLNSSLANLCKSFQIPQEYCKSSMDHDEVNALNWKSLKHIWSPYLDLDVVSLSLIWIKFIQKMRLVSKDIDIKKYCSIAQLSYSVSCKTQKLPYFSDPQLRKFIQRANRGGRVIARNQYFQTQNLDKILELNNVTNIDQLVGKQLTPESLKLIADDYQIAFDATSLYPSAMALPHASYLDAENAKPLTQEECQNFNPEDYKTKKYIIECDLYAPKHLQFVPLSIKTEYGAQFSTGNLRNVVINDVDLFECFRFGYQLKNVYQGVWSEPVQYGFIKYFVETFFAERAKVKNTDSILGDLYKLILNSCYGKFGQKACETQTKFTTKKEMENENLFTDDVLECVELGNGQICYKTKVDQQQGKSMSPHHIAGYILAYSKQIMNNFVLLLGADKVNLISYMDTDSFYIHSKSFDKLKHIQDCLGGGKNDYGENWAIIKGDYLGCKSKVCYIVCMKTHVDKGKTYELGYIKKKVTWKGISQSKFEQIGQTTVDRVKSGNDYMNDIDNWSKSKKFGVGIQHGCSKKLSIEEYCKKYDLVDQVYNFKHLE